MGLNQISEGREQISPPDKDGEIKREHASPLLLLEWQIVVRSTESILAKQPANRVQTSTIERGDLRDAVMNEIKAGSIQQAEWNKFKASEENMKAWAGVDASEYTSSRSPKKRSDMLETIAANMRSVPEYADAMRIRAPKLAERADEFNQNLVRIEDQRVAASLQAKLEGDTAERRARLEAEIDQRAAGSVAALRNEQTAAAARGLGLGDGEAKDATTQKQAVAGLGEPAARSRPGPPTQDQPEPSSEPALLRRPIRPEEVSDELKRQYVVASEGRSVLNKGVTEFALRGGDRDGSVAFVDRGKQLASGLEDRGTVQAMVEVARLKGWHEIHIEGSEQFKRAGWMEAKLSGLDVTGFEPKEADKARLKELQDQAATRNNTIAVQTPREAKQEVATPNSPARSSRTAEPTARSDQQVANGKAARHVDGDNLSEREKAILNPLSKLLSEQGHSTDFVEGTMVELERRMRAHRTHVGELLEHGPAPYKFEDGKAPSHFARLRTPDGELVVWGKKIGDAIESGRVRIGDQIVLSNVGDKPVQVLDRTNGKPEWKGSKLNDWTAVPIDRLRESEVKDAIARSANATPALMVVDPKAQRAERQKPPAAPNAEHGDRQHPNKSRGDKER